MGLTGVVTKRGQRQTVAVGTDDEGSILPLVLVYASVAILLILTCTAATHLYLTQRRLDALADAAALAGSDGFSLSLEGENVIARLTDNEVREQALALVQSYPGEVELVSAEAPDGASARVTVATQWKPPLVSWLLPATVTLESTASSRTALDDD